MDNVPDGEWLRFVGERGWIARLHNKRIRYEPDELDDLMTYGVKAFFIVGKVLIQLSPPPFWTTSIESNGSSGRTRDLSWRRSTRVEVR